MINPIPYRDEVALSSFVGWQRLLCKSLKKSVLTTALTDDAAGTGLKPAKRTTKRKSKRQSAEGGAKHAHPYAPPNHIYYQGTKKHAVSAANS